MIKKTISLLLAFCAVFSLCAGASAEEIQQTGQEPQETGNLSWHIAAGNYHSVWVRNNGTVGSVGKMESGRVQTQDWADVVKVAAHEKTIALLSDGTVVTSDGVPGSNSIANWVDIVDIDLNYCNTIGLTKAGTVVCVGSNTYNQCSVSSWRDIIDVAMSTRTAYGLKSDGTVLTAGSNHGWQRDVENWTDIVAISAGNYFVAGLKSDGTVVTAGIDVGNVRFWKDIVAIDAGSAHLVGLRADGTVVASGANDYDQCSVGGWTDIVAISGGLHHTLALRSDGSLVAAGSNGCNQCKVRN